MTAPRVSLCVIARDEEHMLPGCLASAAFCDEIIVVDSGSADRTVDVARAAGAQVVHQPWLGYGAQRNVALDRATGDWVLELDADERLSAALADEIRAFLADDPDAEIAGLPLRETFLGHKLGPSAKYPKYRHRLVRRGAYRHEERRTVHEGFEPRGPVHPFGGDLEHLLAGTWSEAVGDAWRYARLEAAQLVAPRTPAAILRGAVLRPAAKWLYRLVLDGGWRDGWPGMVKVTLDCGTDAVVWLRHGLGRTRPAGDSGVREQHYGAWPRRIGAARLVGVATSDSGVAEAGPWLGAARAAGADVALVARAPHAALRTRILTGRGPLALARALDAEHQLRPIDGVVPFGPDAARLLRAARAVGAPGEIVAPGAGAAAAIAAALSTREAVA